MNEEGLGATIIIGLTIVLIFAFLVINRKYAQEETMYKLTNNCKVEVEK